MDQTTVRIRDYACGLTYEDLPQDVVHQVKRTLIDTLGCAMGGFEAQPSVIARRLAQHMTGDMASRIIGTTGSSSPDMAAFANGVMVRYLDYNDSYFSPGGGHPSDMIPAVLALADPLARDGRTVITAITLAYEVFCRLSDQVALGGLGWDQGMFSVIGAACGAGKVLGLDADAMGQAISLAVVPNVPLGVTRVGELAMWKGCAAASATRAATFAALLAREGMTGPEAPFEGRRGLWEQAVGKAVQLGAFGGDGVPFAITSSMFKAFPSQIHTQGPISLALELRSQVAVSDIAAIRIQTYGSAVQSAAMEPAKWAPQTRETADHSIPYLVATALCHGPVTPASFTRERLQDADVRALMGKMTVDEDEHFTQRFSDEYNCRIEVSTTSGQRLEVHTVYQPGHWRNPLSDTQVADKFNRLASELLSQERCASVLDRLWSLEKEPHLRAILDDLVVP
jgi:2-methylcitrate dehydratase